jgi:hypothetical protein
MSSLHLDFYEQQETSSQVVGFISFLLQTNNYLPKNTPLHMKKLLAFSYPQQVFASFKAFTLLLQALSLIVVSTQ